MAALRDLLRGDGASIREVGVDRRLLKKKADIVASDEAAKPRKSGKGGKLKRKVYEALLADLHVELVKLQEWVKATGAKVCVVFEGRDGAGKGGVIKAIMERVSPRTFRVVALPPPTERERSQMLMQRYIPHLPAAGEIVIFDRSWYNRAGIERVMGFCTEEEVQKFLHGAPLVERAMVESGIILIKYWLEVGPEEQARRIGERITDLRKIWKLSPMDVKSYDMWDEYSRARDEMFAATDADFAPWYVAYSDDKRRTRLNIISHMLTKVPYETLSRERIRLPKRKKLKGREETAFARHLVPQRY